MRQLSEDHQMIRESAAGFLEEKSPVSAFRALRDAGGGYDRALFGEMAEMGWHGMLVSEEAGGVALGAEAAGLIAEEMGRRLVNAPFLSSSVMAAAALDAGGETSWSAKLASGEAVVAMAVDEANRHRPERIATMAKASGNGFVLNGSKRYVSGGASADAVIVSAMLDGRPALFVVDTSLNGVAREAFKTLDAADAADFTFDEVQLDGSALLAAEDGAEVLSKALRVGRSVAAAELNGVSKEAAERTTAYLKDRKQFGVPLAVFQALQHRAADLYTQIEGSQAVTAAALAAIDTGAPEAEHLSRVAKAKASKTAMLAAREAVQMHGGIGMTDALDIGLFMKKARAAAEYLGDDMCHGEWLLQQRGI